jgi:hypothetical protein
MNVTVSKLILLKSIGNFGPPKFLLSDDIVLPLQLVVPLGNITVVKLPEYEDPDEDKVALILDFEEATIFSSYHKGKGELVLAPQGQSKYRRSDLGEYEVLLML